MKKRVVAVMMAAVTAAGLLAGCGGQGTDSGSGDAQSTEEGKVINIYSWNDEFRTRQSLISTAGMMNSAPVWKLSIRKLRALPMTEQ